MSEMQQHYEEAVAPEADNVIPLFIARPRREREAPVTAEEIAEYRRMRPLLLKMLREWEAIKGAGGCPVARRITP